MHYILDIVVEVMSRQNAYTHTAKQAEAINYSDFKGPSLLLPIWVIFIALKGYQFSLPNRLRTSNCGTAYENRENESDEVDSDHLHAKLSVYVYLWWKDSNVWVRVVPTDYIKEPPSFLCELFCFHHCITKLFRIDLYSVLLFNLPLIGDTCDASNYCISIRILLLVP